MAHFGGSISLDATVMGCSTVTLRKFDPLEVIRAVEAHGITVLPLAPVMLTRLVAEVRRRGEPAPPIRRIPYGGSPMEPSDRVDAAITFPGALTQFYGLAEALAPLAILTPAEHDRGVEVFAEEPGWLSSAGRLQPHVEARLSSGELLVRTPTLMSGYWNREDLTRAVLDEFGWLRTGDLAEFDEHDLLHVLGRTDDVIISGGFNILPGELERAMAGDPCIAEVAVAGVRDERWGRAAHAFVVLVDGCGSDGLLDRLVQRCQRSLADFKKPVAVHIVPTIPRNLAGKVNRRALVALAETKE
jgi:acyl-CoA synthetase (AMP-forming)/AMP-acid ligase II